MTQEGSLCEKILGLHQEGSVREFRQIFESTTSVLPRLSEHVLEGVFINGLRLDIRAEVRLVMPKLEELWNTLKGLKTAIGLIRPWYIWD